MVLTAQLTGPPGIPKEIALLDATMDTLTIAWKNAEDMGVVLDYKVSINLVKLHSEFEFQSLKPRKFVFRQKRGSLTEEFVSRFRTRRWAVQHTERSARGSASQTT